MPTFVIPEGDSCTCNRLNRYINKLEQLRKENKELKEKYDKLLKMYNNLVILS